MALKLSSPFPLFSPNVAPSRRPAFSTELRFSRWHNANAERFERRGREQKEIEDDIRRHRRHQSALRIVEDATAEDADFKSPPPSPAEFRSRGTPSSPSAPSIPGKASKYSKRPLDHKASPPSALHPAFRRFSRARIPPESDEESGISVGDSGIAYRIKGAPFEFQYSYTETPKVKPLAIREPYLPFGPTTMPRPWLGRAPLPPSKKKLPEFDSFKLPPPGKKGIKSIQAPGPFLPGSGPKYHTASREQILGEPLTEEEIKDLVKGSMKTRRQLNMGRDGLTHNMLDNIHALWKRRRVCKIKCKGVCTVDMDNVRQQLEEKTGGKIIYYKGGVIFLFRGRNYNYRTRPKYPLMLWKPVAPVYPRLVQRVPEGLTLEEATVMRKRGRQLPPICKLGKNGVYYKLVNQVREAFEACELVRINCKDMNQSDCRKIGAKLRNLVPCVLVSFEYEHILMWRGKDWKSSLPPLENDSIEGAELITTDPLASPFSTNSLLAADAHISDLDAGMTAKKETTISLSTKDEPLDEHSKLVETEYAMPRLEGANELPRGTLYIPDKTIAKVSGISNHDASTTMFGNIPNSGAACSTVLLQNENEQISYPGEAEHTLVQGGATWNDDSMSTKLDDSTGETVGIENEERGCLPEQNFVRSNGSCLEGVMLLLKQAVDSGAALILDDQLSDANTVFEMSVTLAKTAPPGPIFGQRNRKADVQATEQEKSDNFEQDVKVQAVADSSRKINGKKKPQSQRRDIFNKILPDLVPHGSLAVDELAKLLA